ncbi:MAG: DinB family protein [Chthonomonadaceae bacterium]|nr:DinB family protein [Chthonomonadaceae bacterium]
MATIDVKAVLIGEAHKNSASLKTNLMAIEEEKRNVSPGGVARTPLYMTAECAAINGMVAGFFRGEVIAMPSQEERDAFIGSFDTTEKVLTLLETNTTALAEALSNLHDDQLAETVMTPFGREMSRFEFADMIVGHMNYHRGQLNYVQTLYGDSEMHY